ncbi:MAG: AAA domain-containing protein [Cytophagales bacterium]|nr:AAA domain-containing protein [Bernardetiaceae bacterium]MDW8210803.1 AAA domain-containing protein [Cytophagales bacterium]
MSASLTHLQNLLELIALEKQTEEQEFKQKVEEASLSHQRQSGYTWYPVKIIGSQVTTGNRLRLEIARLSHFDAPLVFQPNAAAMLARWENGKMQQWLCGVITAAWQEKLSLVTDQEELPQWVEESPIGVTLMYDAITYQTMEQALKAVMAAQDNRLAQLREILTGFCPPSFKEGQWHYFPPSLNHDQQKALELVHNACDVAVIHGPPGTGKTTILVEIIRQTVATEKQTLAVAPSNNAADLLAERLSQMGLNVVRLGNPARVGEELQSLTLEAQLEHHPDYRQMLQWRRKVVELFAQASKYKRHFDQKAYQERLFLRQEARQYLKLANQTEEYIINDVLAKAQVIVSTLSGAAHPVLKNRYFKTVFIDEAAQAVEPACWIAIAKAHRVVMAGDHCQLPAVVKSNEAARKGLAISLMERFMSFPYASHASVMLSVQYRMHPDIMAFPSQWFYSNRLQAAINISHEWLHEQLPPMMFIDTAGCGFEEKIDLATGSIFNEQEAMLLKNIICRDRELLPLQIAVVSPYQAQVKLLRQQLDGYPDIEVNTIDSFQGQERESIYISLVRCNTTGQIGFLNDLRRTNVAMTRAKKRLVIIGDSATLGCHPYYQSLIDFAISKNYYRSAWEWL